MVNRDGGPAFPSKKRVFRQGYETNEFVHVDGMTLREYFAIRAFQTRLAKHSDWTLDELTEQAYMDANAMLKAREKT